MGELKRGRAKVKYVGSMQLKEQLSQPHHATCPRGSPIMPRVLSQEGSRGRETRLGEEGAAFFNLP